MIATPHVTTHVTPHVFRQPDDIDPTSCFLVIKSFVLILKLFHFVNSPRQPWLPQTLQAQNGPGREERQQVATLFMRMTTTQPMQYLVYRAFVRLSKDLLRRDTRFLCGLNHRPLSKLKTKRRHAPTLLHSTCRSKNPICPLRNMDRNSRTLQRYECMINDKWKCQQVLTYDRRRIIICRSLLAGSIPC
jgi:hypothetical protein